MPLLLLVLGVVTTVAGLVLVASGLTVRDGTFDTEVLTPGTIAAIGGLLLLGLGVAVRELRRIEHALAARPMPRPARDGDAVAATETLDAAVRMPFAPKPKADTQALPAAPTAAPIEVAASERLRTKFATAARAESGPLMEAADAASTLPALVRVEEDVAEVSHAAVRTRAANGGTAPARPVPRLDAKPRPTGAAARANGSGLNSFWPTRSRHNGQTAAAPVAAPTGEPEPAEPPAAEAAEVAAAAPAPVSVLKSGVVEGMAYTLYSDGSIEAQLPQGTVRFGSISALRDHIESTS